jgi:hypothetical protein
VRCWQLSSPPKGDSLSETSARRGQRPVFQRAWGSLCATAAITRLTAIGASVQPAGTVRRAHLPSPQASGGTEHRTGGAPQRPATTISGHKTRSIFDRYKIVNEADFSGRPCSAHKAICGKTDNKSGGRRCPNACGSKLRLLPKGEHFTYIWHEMAKAVDGQPFLNSS